MFPSQMVRLKIVSHSNRPLYRCFLSQRVRLKIVSHSNQRFYPCFPRKWYALKLFPTQIGHFIHVYMPCIFCCISPTQSSRISHCRSHDIVTQQKFLRELGSLPIGTVSAANETDWLPKCGFRASGKFGRQNGDDQCLKLLPEKRQIPWPTVDIV